MPLNNTPPPPPSSFTEGLQYRKGGVECGRGWEGTGLGPTIVKRRGAAHLCWRPSTITKPAEPPPLPPEWLVLIVLVGCSAVDWTGFLWMLEQLVQIIKVYFHLQVNPGMDHYSENETRLFRVKRPTHPSSIHFLILLNLFRGHAGC